jgi:hypothetical protein
MNQQPAHTERAKHAAVRSSIYLTPLLCKLQDHTSDIIICVWLSDMTKDYILSREIGQLGPCFVTRPRSRQVFTVVLWQTSANVFNLAPSLFRLAVMNSSRTF